MKRFEVLKIVFKMKTPLLLGHPWIFFDSLIIHTLLRRELGDNYYNLPSKYPLQEMIDKLDVPIRRIYYDNGKFFYDCSVSIIDYQFYPYKNMYVTHVRKKFTEKYVHEVKTKKSKIEIAKGPFKLYDIKFIYVPCREVMFLVNGVESDILELLKYVKAIGKKRVEGFGFIKEINYEKLDMKNAIVMYDSIVTRPIPVKLIDINETLKKYKHCEVVNQTVKPPYWNIENMELCTVPGRRYVLKSEYL